MSVKTPPAPPETDLSSLAEALGAILSISLSLGYAQEQCVISSLKRYRSLAVSGSYQKYEIYPAIAASQRVVSEASNDPTKIFRQGIVIRTTDTGKWYYIGGISPYWGRDTLIIYQGGSKVTSSGKIAKSVYEKFLEKTGGLGVIPLVKYRVPEPRYNPPLFKNCQGSFGLFWDFLAEAFEAGILAMSTLAPLINIQASLKSFIQWTYESDSHYYLTREAEDIMRTASDSYPYLQILLGTNPQVAKTHGLLVYPSFTTNYPIKPMVSECDDLMSDAVCGNLESGRLYLFQLNDMDIGAPVFAQIPCGINSCSQFGLAGFVLGINSYRLVKIDNIDVTIYYVRIVQPPSDFTETAIKNYADTLGILDVLNVLENASSKAEKGESALSAIYPLPIAALAVTAVDWIENSYDEAYKEAEKVAERLYQIYNNVLSYANSCIEAQPNLPRNAKVMYEQQVQQYLNSIFYDISPDWNDNEIQNYLENKVNEYLSNQGIYC
ncbi:hypothetical protein SJAV_05930 [Sulfurisphaera javensis]|uniref:Uncharacterized protein n=1 Tax=Sulfurisphaera javensis TaxID=2049879 RepID=A0AAT9GPA1_9CREN